MCRIVNSSKIDHGTFERITGLALRDCPSEYRELLASVHARNFNDPPKWLHWRGIACGGCMHRIERWVSLARARQGCEE